MGSHRQSGVVPVARLDRIGLCASCRYAETVGSSHGSTFWLCRLSATDPRFPKYPRLPVVACEGHEAAVIRDDNNDRPHDRFPT